MLNPFAEVFVPKNTYNNGKEVHRENGICDRNSNLEHETNKNGSFQQSGNNHQQKQHQQKNSSNTEKEHTIPLINKTSIETKSTGVWNIVKNAKRATSKVERCTLHKHNVQQDRNRFSILDEDDDTDEGNELESDSESEATVISASSNESDGVNTEIMASEEINGIMEEPRENKMTKGTKEVVLT